jgi:DNA-binding response OmpR family regulator
MDAKILIIWDSSLDGAWISQALRQTELTVSEAVSTERIQMVRALEQPDLILVYADAHSDDTVELVEQLRGVSGIPLLLLVTNQVPDELILDCYQAGVDECIQMPVSPAIVEVKVRAWLKRSGGRAVQPVHAITAGELRLDPARRSLTMAGGFIVPLSSLEFRLLAELMNHPGMALEADEIIRRVWGFTYGADRTLLKNVVYRLRRKIEPDPSRPRYIHTEASGYRLQA